MTCLVTLQPHDHTAPAVYVPFSTIEPSGGASALASACGSGTSSPACRLHRDGSMPIRYEFDRAHGRLITHADGVITFHDIDAHLDVEQRKRALELPELFDARGATTDLTTDQVRKLVDRATDMLRVVDIGATAVVTDDPALYGMARVYAQLADRVGISAAVFRDVRAASRWLDRFDLDGD